MSLIYPPYPGIYTTNTTNFPALKHLFPCTEATGATALFDIIGGVSIGGATLTNNADGTLTPSGILNTLDLPWANPTGKNVLLMVSGKSTSGNATVGTISGSNYGARILISAGNFTTNCNATIATIANPKVGTGAAGTWALSAKYGDASGLLAYGVLSTDTAVASTAAVSLATSTIGQWSNTVAISAAIVPSIISLWHFTTLPTADQIKAACAWTNYYSMNSFNGTYNKVPYPGFKGMT